MASLKRMCDPFPQKDQSKGDDLGQSFCGGNHHYFWFMVSIKCSVDSRVTATISFPVLAR
jgi:hypothetical protein